MSCWWTMWSTRLCSGLITREMPLRTCLLEMVSKVAMICAEVCAEP